MKHSFVWSRAVILGAFAIASGRVPAAPAGGPALTVNVAANRHAIDADIYGITWFYNQRGTADAAFAAFARAIRLPISRHGGDATTRYNWNVDSSNAGNDWFFTAGNGQPHGTATPSASVDHMVAENTQTHTKQILTIPTIEYINSDSPWHCGFPKEDYPAQQAYNPYVPYGGGECGNGYDAQGHELFGNDPLRSDVANTPATQTAWVRHLVARFGRAISGGVAVYEMDNEPTAWGFQHRDVHPVPVTCDEIVAQDLAYGIAAKTGDPTAAVLGPGDIPPADEFACHGTTDGLYFLRAMAQYQARHGSRVLDYYSMHYPGCCSGDPIANTVAHVRTHLSWIAQAYPGTRLGYDEWNDGTPSDFTASLLHADTLGVFGREGVSLASFWGFGVATDPTAFVWRMYLNYDGRGDAFGDVSVSAFSADTTQLTIYAAVRSRDAAITVSVLNKTGAARSSVLHIAGAAPLHAIQQYVYSAARPTSIVRLADLPFNAAGVTVTYPAESMTILVAH